jgi:outer membrane protein OmpA-like peptidoglycan-associated protein
MSSKGGIMNKCIFSAMIICMIFVTGYADETAGKTEIGFKGGVNSYWGDIDDRQVNGSAAVALFWWLSDPFALGLSGGASFLQAEQNQNYFKTMLYQLTPMIKVKLFPSSPINPYLQAGFELMYINPQAKDNTKLPHNAAAEYKNLQYAVPFGGGFSVFVSEVTAIELEAMYHQALTDYLDDIKVGERYDGYFTLTLGLTFNLGKPRDADRDGIADKYDGDPARAEDFDGYEDRDGIPDPDNDQDGIPDYSDMARNDAEDHDAFQDKDGVPDPDNDADGIKDVNDKMPGTDATLAAGTDTKEDIDSFQDDDGAPDPDNDADGILDVNDKCPNQAETLNDYQDEDGCPDSKPEVEVGQSIVLEGVNFASGSAELEPNSMRILDDVVQKLKEHPEIEIEIRGYTDNTGSYQGNINISKRRADSVKNYLVQQGILSNRISTRGYGPDNPIASNATREDRAKNRRIEFYRVR